MQFLVIGNGIAGISAAYTIRRLDKEASITIITKDPHPAYSACVLPNYISGEIGRDTVFIKAFRDHSLNGIHLKRTAAIDLEIGRKRVMMDPDEILSFDRLIIATGSKPILPPIKGADMKGVYTLKSLEDADRINSHEGQIAVVVGSGPIGVEASLALKRRGYRVFLVELLGWILPQVFAEFPASIIKEILLNGAIEVYTQERVVEILGSGSVQAVLTNRRTIECDTVIMAAGMRPDVQLVERVLEIGSHGGLLADDKMCSNVSDIYLCGDCAETKNLINGQPILSLLWHSARQQGEIAGSNACGVPRTYPGSLNVTGLDLLGIQAVSIGNVETDLENGLDVIERKRDGGYQRLILSNGVLVGAQSVNWSDNMGVLLSAIVRKEKIKSARDLFASKRRRFAFPRFHPFGQKLAKDGSLCSDNQISR
jgi:NAD(P)H-nitrite reductase large subunit